jgi:hypothetical protein
LLDAFPAVLVTGPRAAGKTSTAIRHVADVARLDLPDTAAIFRADPDVALRSYSEPLLIDEWQEVPEVLGAVKRAVDHDSHPNRFVLTGSVRAELDQKMWPGTGRIIRVEMFGMTEAEARGRIDHGHRSFVDRLTTPSAEAFVSPDRTLRVDGYAELAVRGGYPELVLQRRSVADREAWVDSYLAQVLSRDVHTFSPRANGRKMRRYFEAVSLNTAGTPTAAKLAGAAEINAKTAAAYDQLFEDLIVAERVPAWTKNRLARSTHLPKRYVIDPALAAAAADIGAGTLMRDGDLLGRHLDTFVMAQLRPELALARHRTRAHHVRIEEGRHEIDLLIEIGGGRLVALECKATSAPTRRDARHLIWLRDQLGDAFVAGAVLHTGPEPFELDHRILAIPIRALWS